MPPGRGSLELGAWADRHGAAAELRLEQRFTAHLFGAAHAQATLDWQTRMLDAKAEIALGGRW